MGYPARYPIRDGMVLEYGMGKNISYLISLERYTSANREHRLRVQGSNPGR